MPPILITPPAWIDALLAGHPRHYPDDAARIALALELAAANVRHGTGGPFGAALFARADGRLLGVGVNLVTGARCSIAHAELVALAATQQRLGSHDLAAVVPGGVVLAASAEPCAMCLGALPWAGLAGLLCAARDEDVRAIGFDEGDKPADWPALLAGRGIEVTRDLARAQAVDILRVCRKGEGVIY